MSTEDIKDLLYRKLKEVYYGIPVYKDRHPPYKKGKVPERIVVHMGTMSNTPWSMGYANINILVPCLESMGYKTPNNTRLNELQQIAITAVLEISCLAISSTAVIGENTR